MNTQQAVTSRSAVAQQAFIHKVYWWMSCGLAITGLTAMYVALNPSLLKLIVGTRFVFYGMMIAELVLVVRLSAAINKMTASTATMMFVLYSILSGATLSVIFLAYTASSIASTFFITAGTFGALAMYGTATKTDLTSVGNICFMGLIGIIIASIVNIFMHSSAIYWVTTCIGVLVFVGLTAYDAQRIKSLCPADENNAEAFQKGAIIGALALYLDFINLFILLLNLFGRRR